MQQANEAAADVSLAISGFDHRFDQARPVGVTFAKELLRNQHNMHE